MGVSASNAIAYTGQTVTLDASDMCVTGDPDAELVTRRLGACMVVMIHDPVRCAGGMIRFVLPDSQINPQRAQQRPAMFADTAIPLLVESLLALGCREEDLVVKAAGGGGLRASGDVFDFGQRNCQALQRVCAELGLVITAQDVGGAASRTAILEVGSGAVTIESQGKVSAL